MQCIGGARDSQRQLFEMRDSFRAGEWVCEWKKILGGFSCGVTAVSRGGADGAGIHI